MMMNTGWKSHHFAIGAANTVDIGDKPPKMTITDMDINSIKITVPDAALMKTPDELLQEKNFYLMQKHNFFQGENGENEEMMVDENLLFSINIANELASIQSKTLAFIEEEDDLDEILYKHHMTLRRFEHNMGAFNEQLEQAIRNEEEFESHAIQSSQLNVIQNQMNTALEEASMMRNGLNMILTDSRALID